MTKPLVDTIESIDSILASVLPPEAKLTAIQTTIDKLDHAPTPAFLTYLQHALDVRDRAISFNATNPNFGYDTAFQFETVSWDFGNDYTLSLIVKDCRTDTEYAVTLTFDMDVARLDAEGHEV